MKEEKKKIQNNFIVAAGLLALFILYTVAIMFVDVQPIGPQGSSVGFAEVNQYFHTLFGVNMLLYSITDWLSIAVLFIMFGFAMVGLVQLIKRKSPQPLRQCDIQSQTQKERRARTFRAGKYHGRRQRYFD